MQNQSISGANPGPGGEDSVRPVRTFAVVGPGKVGISLTRALQSTGAGCRRIGERAGPARSSGAETPTGAGLADVARVPWQELRSDDVDLLLVCVADPALDEVCAALAQRPQAPVALHVAGRFDAEKIAPLRQAGCAVGTLHPLRAFPRPLRADELHETWFAVDGDPPAKRMAAAIAEALGGRWAEVGGEARALYHFAATLAAGGVVTLMAVIEEVARTAGLPDAMLDAYLELTRGALAPLYAGERPVAPQITGPAARGDYAALADQRRALGQATPHLLPVVEALQRETLRRCGHAVDGAPGGPTRREFAPPSHGKRE